MDVDRNRKADIMTYVWRHGAEDNGTAQAFDKRAWT